MNVVESQLLAQTCLERVREQWTEAAQEDARDGHRRAVGGVLFFSPDGAPLGGGKAFEVDSPWEGAFVALGAWMATRGAEHPVRALSLVVECSYLHLHVDTAEEAASIAARGVESFKNDPRVKDVFVHYLVTEHGIDAAAAEITRDDAGVRTLGAWQRDLAVCDVEALSQSDKFVSAVRLFFRLCDFPQVQITAFKDVMDS